MSPTVNAGSDDYPRWIWRDARVAVAQRWVDRRKGFQRLHPDERAREMRSLGLAYRFIGRLVECCAEGCAEFATLRKDDDTTVLYGWTSRRNLARRGGARRWRCPTHRWRGRGA